MSPQNNFLTEPLNLELTSDDNQTILNDQELSIEQIARAGSNDFYKYDIILRTGDTVDNRSVARISNSPSINDLGQVAVVGNLLGPGQVIPLFGGNSLLFNDGSSPIALADTNNLNIKFSDPVQINNRGQIVTHLQERPTLLGGSAPSRVVLYNTQPNFTPEIEIATAGGNFRSPIYPFDFHTIEPVVTINNKGEVVTTAINERGNLLLDTNLNTNPRQFNFVAGEQRRVLSRIANGLRQPLVSVPNNSSLEASPVIDDLGVVISTIEDQQNKPNIRRSGYLPQFNNVLVNDLLGPVHTFTKIGLKPGVSEDGDIIVFYGKNNDGPGIFASIRTSPDSEIRTLVSITGVPDNGILEAGETFTDSNDNGVFDPGEPDISIFSDFEDDVKVAVNSTHKGEEFTDRNNIVNGLRDFGESFTDTNGNRRFDPRQFTDTNGNGRFDPREFIDANGNGIFDPGEFTDTNGNGIIDPGELTDTNGDGMLDPGETRFDINRNGIIDSGEILLTDVNSNGRFDPAEFIDSNGNGRFDPREFTDLNGNNIFDPAELFLGDFNGNGFTDPGEFTDFNGNGIFDRAEPFLVGL